MTAQQFMKMVIATCAIVAVLALAGLVALIF